MPKPSYYNKPRRVRACKNCTIARAACQVGSTDLCCLLCERKGFACDPPLPSSSNSGAREANDLSELRSQISRFEDVLRNLENQPLDRQTTPRKGAQHRKRNDSPPPVSEQQNVEVNDLVAALTELCFRQDRIASGPKSKLVENELVTEARAVLSKPDNDLVKHLPSGGFTFEPSTDTRSLRDLIDALPPEMETFWLLEDVYMGRWSRSLDGLFHATWPLRIRQLYRSGFDPAPHPHLLAELFGVLAIACSVLQTGHELTTFAEKRAQWQDRSDRYADLLQQALTLGDYLDDPSPKSARALCLQAQLYLACSSSTCRLARGLALLPVAFAALEHLGFHAPESAFEGHETPAQQYSRRALVTTLLRLDWAYSSAFGRRAITDPSTWQVEPPTESLDEDLPLEARDSPFRMPPILIHAMRSGFRIVRLQQQVVADVYANAKSADYSKVVDYAAQVNALWDEVVLPHWRFYDDPVTGLRRWGDQSDPDRVLEMDDRYARLSTVGKLLKLQLTLHRPFAHPQAAAAGLDIDVAWHRDIVLTVCRNIMLLFRDNHAVVGPFSSNSSQGFDGFVGICVLIFSNPDSPEVVKHRYELSTAIVNMVKSPTAPPAVMRLGRLAAFLLSQPKHRSLESAGHQEGKRTRKSLFEERSANPAASTKPKEAETASFDFCCEPSAFSRIPTSSERGPCSVEEILQHKRPASTSAPSSTKSFSPLDSRRCFSNDHTVRLPSGLVAASDLSMDLTLADIDPCLLQSLGADLAKHGELSSFAVDGRSKTASPSDHSTVSSVELDSFEEWLHQLPG